MPRVTATLKRFGSPISPIAPLVSWRSTHSLSTVEITTTFTSWPWKSSTL
eukprot:CAMPEP_0184969364 /NCGR_PEP_ID=MMETSP1098-20130426/2130_1 /TAXON_ID=89044 /ORGANISM="Spumella elongata, Strain CCAP 955/1" /LENGTH=49 /DNA_ID= /DNA_START= /DNA_END= /DNA_ORIENTATION=